MIGMNSNSNSAAEYYRPISSVEPEELQKLCAPLTVMDETTHPDGIGVRHIVSYATNWLDDSARLKLGKYMGALYSTLGDTIQGVDPNSDLRYHPGSWRSGGVDLRGEKLVDPRIVTGKLASLSISAVAPGELPFAVNRIPRHAVMLDGRPIQAYFRIVGILKMGGSRAVTACGIAATAISERRSRIYGDEEYTEALRYFSTRERRYPATSATALWELIKQQAATNEAVNKLRPIG